MLATKKMSCEVFPSLLSEIVCVRLLLLFLLFHGIHQWNHRAWNFLDEKVLITNSISLIDIGLFRFSVSSFVRHSKLYFLRNLSISFMLSNLILSWSEKRIYLAVDGCCVLILYIYIISLYIDLKLVVCCWDLLLYGIIFYLFNYL